MQLDYIIYFVENRFTKNSIMNYMHPIKLKTLSHIIVFSFLSFYIKGQSIPKYLLTYELCPNISMITREGPTGFGQAKYYISKHSPKISFLSFMRVESNTTKKIKPTIGIGILSVGKWNDYGDEPSYKSEIVKNKYNITYAVVPLGISVKLAKINIIPEIGCAYMINANIKTQNYTIEGKRTSLINVRMNNLVNKITVPVFLSINKEIKLGSISSILGIKGYYSLNNVYKYNFDSDHYYGLGLNIGIIL